MMMKWIICSFLIWAGNLAAFGQFYNTGQAPFSVKWMHIKTENFQVIYPRGFYEQANHVAIVLEFMYGQTSADLKREPARISVLLYNESVRSNGYVVWAPKRSEWITTPPEEMYAQNWLDQLALHEFRHVVQLDKLNQNFTQVLYLVFGEMAVGAVAGYLPFWFLEGDATVNETAFSSSGRGRQPDFDKHLRAIELEKDERYSYDQSYLGSYKHYIPNRYVYGYQMVAYGRLKYGPDLWSTTLDHVASKPHTLAPFYFGLKKGGAGSKIKLYHETFDSLKTMWDEQSESHDLLFREAVDVPSTRHFTNYIFPQKTSRGIVAAKTGIDDITRFVLIDDGGGEDVMYTPGRYSGSYFSTDERYLVWTEQIPHPRWQQVSWSVIKRLDLVTRKVVTLTSQSRYFSPDISPDGRQIACVEVDIQNRYALVILDIQTGEIIRRIPAAPGDAWFSPRWMNDSELALLVMKPGGKEIETIDLTSGSKNTVFQTGFVNMTSLHAVGDSLFFAYDGGNSRQIYMLSLDNGNLYVCTNERFEADFPCFDRESGKLIYSAYSLEGFRPCAIGADQMRRIRAENLPSGTRRWAEALSDQSEVDIQQATLPDSHYDSLPYRRVLHALNIHSWAPFYFDPQDLASYDLKLYPGISLLLQNKLSTVTSTVSYYYANESNYFTPRITWAGVLPVFEFIALFRDKAGAIRTNADIDAPANIKNYYNLEITSYLPLNLSRNKFNRSIRPGISYVYENAYYVADSSYRLGRDYLQFSFSAANQLMQSHRDLFPRFGQTLYLSHRFSPGDPSSFGTGTVANLNLYFPGLFPHHALRINYGHQRLAPTAYTPEPSINLPRGYSYSTESIYTDVLRISGEYYFPFLYPDLSLGPLVYIKRFHGSFFTDYALTSKSENPDDKPVQSEYLSVGGTLASQMHFLRFFVPFTLKITGAYLPVEKTVGFSFSVSIDAAI